MAIKWKLFKKTFPHVCKECATLSNMFREYCESCGAQDSLRPVTKEDYVEYSSKNK